MKNMVLIGEVASLARQIENSKEDFREQLVPQMSVASNVWSPRNIQAMVSQGADEAEADTSAEVVGAADAANAFMASRVAAEKMDGKQPSVNTSMASALSLESVASGDPEFTRSQQMEMAELLDAWEEPKTVEEQEVSTSHQ